MRCEAKMNVFVQIQARVHYVHAFQIILRNVSAMMHVLQAARARGKSPSASPVRRCAFDLPLADIPLCQGLIHCEMRICRGRREIGMDRRALLSFHVLNQEVGQRDMLSS